ncbi:hypothetical protein M0R72_16200 [Candidatus Pacearchaeota archaeon]|nr:hypothetical protein [Candidatus Pacearchaeota archaeon]
MTDISQWLAQQVAKAARAEAQRIEEEAKPLLAMGFTPSELTVVYKPGQAGYVTLASPRGRTTG